MKTVPSVNTVLINAIYLSHSTKEAQGTVFRKNTVLNQENLRNYLFHLQLISYKLVLVLGVYTHSMETIYLSLRAKVAVGTFS